MTYLLVWRTPRITREARGTLAIAGFVGFIRLFYCASLQQAPATHATPPSYRLLQSIRLFHSIVRGARRYMGSKADSEPHATFHASIPHRGTASSPPRPRAPMSFESVEHPG
jgi:hypothetical protein